MELDCTPNVPLHENDISNIILGDQSLDVLTDIIAMKTKNEMLTELLKKLQSLRNDISYLTDFSLNRFVHCGGREFR